MLTIIKSQFLESKLTILRNKKTSNNVFRQVMNETSFLIAAEVLKKVPYEKDTIETPLAKTSGNKISKKIVFVPILRAGLGLVEGFTKLLPDAERGHIGLYRDEQTYRPVEYLCKLPSIKNKFFIVLDPMLATGHSASAAIRLLLKSGVKINNMFFVSLLSSPEGIKQLRKDHKNIRIFTASMDKKLNKNKFIVPGLGDAGDRYMGT
tara:strand:- start:122 stop:742 length:621 start_codon:yes stop_codon:yes gene_type:complete